METVVEPDQTKRFQSLFWWIEGWDGGVVEEQRGVIAVSILVLVD